MSRYSVRQKSVKEKLDSGSFDSGLLPPGFDIERRVKKYKFTAYCSSHACLTEFRRQRKVRGTGAKYGPTGLVPKLNVDRNQIDCTECGSSLFWERTEITSET